MKHILNIFYGMIIGTANVIPGVSGGTMAVILGIYPELTESIGEFFITKEKRKQYFVFLFLIFIGAAAGILIFAKVLTSLLGKPSSAFVTYSFFAGLIVGSVPFIFTIHKDMKPTLLRGGLILLGAAPIVLLSLFVDKEALGVVAGMDFNLLYGLWLVVCGFLSAGSMIVPGFSGSALLVALGEYGNILAYIDNRTILPLVFFGVGAVLGLLVFAKVIDICFKKFPSETLYVILGLLVGSVYQIVLELTFSGHSTGMLVLAGLFFILGTVASFLLSRIKKSPKKA